MGRAHDYVIAGAGITGLALARELVLRRAGRILALEKEPAPGRHASGRNSGVLHAGIYYAPGTLKARFCLDGNRRWKAYCREHGLHLFESGKTIVTRSEDELPTLRLLAERARGNGALVELIDERQLYEIEPHAKTTSQALHSLETGAADPKEILTHLSTWLAERGVEFRFNQQVISREKDGLLRTSNGPVAYGTFINAAGAYSDTIARSFGCARDVQMLPFRGRYQMIRASRNYLVKGNIYPVPDLRNPFLGVHLSRNIHGDVYAGPTAAPVLNREQYTWLPRNLLETLSTGLGHARLFLRNAGFRANAAAEIRRYGAGFLREVQVLVPEFERGDLLRSTKLGIRPQLVNLAKGELINDFLVERAPDSLHVLNAISPAFTSALPFAEFLVDEYGIG